MFEDLKDLWRAWNAPPEWQSRGQEVADAYVAQWHDEWVHAWALIGRQAAVDAFLKMMDGLGMLPAGISSIRPQVPDQEPDLTDRQDRGNAPHDGPVTGHDVAIVHAGDDIPTGPGGQRG